MKYLRSLEESEELIQSVFLKLWGNHKNSNVTKMKYRLIISSVILIAIMSCNSGDNPVLKIEGGEIQGIPSETPGVYFYKGIPFAAPPVRRLALETTTAGNSMGRY